MLLRGFYATTGLSRALFFGLWMLVATELNGQGPLRTEPAPSGWFLAGSNPTNYRTGADRDEMHDGIPSAYLASLANDSGFGTLMKSISAANYAGKRVRLRGWVKSQDVDDCDSGARV